jgi:anti-sigma B factor antagonist
MTPEPDFFWLQVKTINGVAVARVQAAELWTDQQVGALTAELLHLVDDLGPAPKLVLDFGEVTGMGSRMIGQLAALHKQVKAAGGRLALCRVRPEVAEVIETCKLTTHSPRMLRQRSGSNSVISRCRMTRTTSVTAGGSRASDSCTW